jgi:hypothetical protein
MNHLEISHFIGLWRERALCRLDAVNAVFELGGAMVLTRNVRALWRDRRIAGVTLLPTLWFQLFGAWNLYFYYQIGQRLSSVAGMSVFAVNTAWLLLALWFTRGTRA